MEQIWRSSPRQAFAIFAGVFCAMAAVAVSEVSADGFVLDDLITAQLVDGRVVQGKVGPRTAEQFLWLNSAEPNLTVVSRFDWTQVIAVAQGTANYSVKEFKSHLRARRRDVEAAKPTDIQPAVSGPSLDEAAGPGGPLPAEARSSDEVIAPFSVEPQLFSGVRHALHADRRAVQSLHVQAKLANWDDDVEPDGLLVRVTPLDWSGHVVPVDASLDFRLLGLPQRYTGGQKARRSEPTTRLGEWSRRLRVHDFGADGAFFKLAFRGFDPGRDFDVAPEGLLTARLGVSGVGVFEASDEFVVLRPTSRVRDELQLRTGRRFLDGRLRSRRDPRSGR